MGKGARRGAISQVAEGCEKNRQGIEKVLEDSQKREVDTEPTSLA